MTEYYGMKRCRQCLEKAEPRNDRCPVCGMGQEKTYHDLTPAERRVRHHARGIRLVAMTHLVLAAMGILMMPEFSAPAAIAVLSVVNALLAYGLIRYSLTAYRAATTFYFLLGMVNIISIQHGIEHLGGIALALIGLYLVGNGHAKAIFERRLPDLP